jgi:mRNA interferase MazF
MKRSDDLPEKNGNVELALPSLLLSMPTTTHGSKSVRPRFVLMRAGDIIVVDFGVPHGSEPGFNRPSIVVTADLVAAANPTTLHVVPITSNTTRRLPTEVELETTASGVSGMAQVHLCSVVSRTRIVDNDTLDNIGPSALSQIRSVLADLLDLP